MTVNRVVDGYTIEVRPAVPGTERMRLIGVDTRRPSIPTGPRSARSPRASSRGESVTLIFERKRTDRYGRALAYVRPGGQSTTFNETLLRQGYAQLDILPPNDRYEARFRQAQEQARQAQRGIWGLPQNQQCQLANLGNGIGEGAPGCSSNLGPAPPGPGPPAGDKNCSDYPSQAAAQAELRRDPEDPFGLDGPKGRATTGIPGEACEDNPPPKDLRPPPGYGGVPPTPPPQAPQGPQLPRTSGPSPAVVAVLLLGAAVAAGRSVLRW